MTGACIKHFPKRDYAGQAAAGMVQDLYRQCSPLEVTVQLAPTVHDALWLVYTGCLQ